MEKTTLSKTGPKLTQTYADGVVANLPAFINLILNRRIWKKASFQVQEILFESLAKLVTTHEHAAFNVIRFRSANVMDKLILMFQDEERNLPLSLATSFITIIRHIMTDPPCADDLSVCPTLLSPFFLSSPSIPSCLPF